MIITGEADIAKVPLLNDRREIRNYMRFLRLWPHHGFDMLARPRWQRYLALSPSEASAMQTRGYPRTSKGNSDGNNV